MTSRLPPSALPVPAPARVVPGAVPAASLPAGDAPGGRRPWAAWALGLAVALLVSHPAHAFESPAPGSLEAGTLTLPSGPASIQGLSDGPQLDLFTGQIDYAVPIELPAAQVGFKPRLSLLYAGGLGNGPVGIGWSVGAMEIRRTLDEGVPRYDATDALELRGSPVSGRLVALADGTWRVEGQGQSVRVMRQGDGWRVDDGSGMRYTFGTTASGRREGPDGTFSWLLERVEDPAGHAARVAWRHDRGEAYLDGLTWGPGDAFQADLLYAPRPDAVTSWRTGFEVVTALRLERIEVRSHGEVLSTTHLAYERDRGFSRLARLDRTGRGGEGRRPPLSFVYGTPDTPVVEEVADVAYTLAQPDTTLADIDGDGASDLVRLALGDHRYWRNLGGSFAPARPLPGAQDVSLSGGAMRLMDVDGDARPELVRELLGWRVHELVDGGFSPAVPWADTDGEPLVDPDTAFADLDGDGRTDVLRAAGAGLLVRFNGPGGLGLAESRPGVSPGEPLEPGMPGVRFQDVNGDGLADCAVTGLSSLRLFLGRGDGTFAAPQTVALPFAATDPTAVRLADLDRDGLTDVLHVEAGAVTWYPMRAEGALAAAVSLPRPPGLDATVVVTTADLNGNGSEDVVWSTADRMWLLDFAGTRTAAMLSGLTMGLGRSLTFRYRPSTWLLYDDEDASRPWDRLLPISIPVVVESTERIAGEPLDRVVRHHLRDGVYDGEDRTFAGFLSAERTLPAPTGAGTLVETTHHHPGLGEERALRGRAWRVEQRDGDGRLLSSSLTQWEAMALAGLPDVPRLRLAVPREVVDEVWEGTDTPVRSRVTYGYDGEGNPVEVVDEGRLDLEGDESRHTTTFAANDATWVRGKPVSDTVEALDGTVLSRTRTLYDGAQEPLPSGELTWGRVRRNEAWYEEEGRWVLQGGTDHDAHGNPIRTYSAGVWKTVGYDGAGLHPVTEEVEVSPGRVLTWTLSWDPVLGAPLALTDPNGTRRSTTYDALGRPVETRVDGTVTETYAYDWDTPQPRTWTRVHDGEAGEHRLVSGFNGAGEMVFAGVEQADGRWLLSEWQRRDARGQTVFTSVGFEWEGAGLPEALPAGVSGSLTRYDALGRVVERVTPDGATERSLHGPGTVTREMEGLAPVTTWVDAAGRSIRTLRQVDGVEEQVEARYDALGRMVSMTLQGGEAWQSWRYDSLGRLASSDGSDGGGHTYAWDDAGRLLSDLNGEGQAIRYAYDGVGRLVRKEIEDGGRFEFGYDLPRSGSGEGAHLLGRLAWTQGPLGATELAYDAFGRVRDQRQVIEGASFRREQHHTPSGRLLWTRYDDAARFDYRYDGAGRLEAIEGPLGEVWRALELDPDGRLLEVRHGNGILTRYQRDRSGAPTGIQVAGQDGPLYDLALTRNPYGAITEVADLDGRGLDHAARYGFDGAGRIVSGEVGGFTFRYAYDALQNRTLREADGPRTLPQLSGTYRYGENGSGPRQLSTAAGVPLEWDTAGRATRRGDTGLRYDASDRLREVTLPDGGVVTHYYGADGNRILTRRPDGGTERWFGGEAHEVAGRRSYYVRVGGQLVARLDLEDVDLPTTQAAMLAPAGLGLGLFLFIVAAGRRSLRIRLGVGLSAFALGSIGCTSSASEVDTVYFHHGVGAGPALITDADGEVVDERRYEPLGTPIDFEWVEDPHGWGNKPVDPDTGYADHGARWMATEVGSWLAPDPALRVLEVGRIASPWRLNPYAFALHNPLSFWDPDGREDAPQSRWTDPRIQNLMKVRAWLIGQRHGEAFRKEHGYVAGRVALASGRAAVWSSERWVDWYHFVRPDWLVGSIDVGIGGFTPWAAGGAIGMSLGEHTLGFTGGIGVGMPGAGVELGLSNEYQLVAARGLGAHRIGTRIHAGASAGPLQAGLDLDASSDGLALSPGAGLDLGDLVRFDVKNWDLGWNVSLVDYYSYTITFDDLEVLQETWRAYFSGFEFGLGSRPEGTEWLEELK